MKRKKRHTLKNLKDTLSLTKGEVYSKYSWERFKLTFKWQWKHLFGRPCRQKRRRFKRFIGEL